MGERLRYLVFVVPGIGGSVLEDARGNVVWGRRRDLPAVAIRPERLADPGVRVREVLGETSLLPPAFVVAGYNDLLRRILSAFPGSEGNVVPVPYDFRLGVAVGAERLRDTVEEHLAGVSTDARRDRVIVIGHSMGGLVARYWFGLLGGAECCRALITLGTPHRGAPKALDLLVNGVKAGPLKLDGFTELLRGWPSAYDLLPRYKMIDGALYPHDLSEVAGSGFAQRAKAAYEMHVDIETALDPHEYAHKVVLFYGVGHATPSFAELTGTTLRVNKATDIGLPNAQWQGDGTVPALSATPPELDGFRNSWRAVPYRHRPMASFPDVIKVLRAFNGEPTAAVRGEETLDRPRLGLDLEDVHLAGQDIPLTITLHNTDHAEAVWIGIEGRPDIRCGLGQTVIPGLPPGQYRVRVSAVGVPDVDQVHCDEVIGVVEP